MDTYDYKVAEQYHHILNDPSDFMKVYNSAQNNQNSNSNEDKTKLNINQQENLKSYESPTKRR